jgi:hypothetical protein
LDRLLDRTRDLAAVLCLVTVSLSLGAFLTSMARQDLASSLQFLLLAALLAEFASPNRLGRVARAVAAAAASAAIAALLSLYPSRETPPPELILPTCVFFLLYAATTTLRTAGLHRRIQTGEIARVSISFLLAAASILRLAPASGQTRFGLFCAVLSVAVYLAALEFDKLGQPRNYRSFAAWGLVLYPLGCLLCLNPPARTAAFALAAIAVTGLGVRGHRLTLAFHGIVFLLAAVIASGMTRDALRILAGTSLRGSPEAHWMLEAAILFCYALGGQVQEDHWQQLLFQTLSGILAVLAAAVAFLSALNWVASLGSDLGADRRALARTLVIAALAVSLAYLGPRWRRIELLWLAYASLACLAVKILRVDLQLDPPELTTASVFIFVAALISVPRLTRRARPRPGRSPNRDSIRDPDRAPIRDSIQGTRLSNP